MPSRGSPRGPASAALPLFLSAVIAAGACGTRTGLGIDDGSAPTLLFEIECDDAPIQVPARQPLTVRVHVEGRAVRHEWRVLTVPPRTGELRWRASEASLTFTPERQGVHEFLYRTHAESGETRECRITIIAEPAPPTLTCPDLVEGAPLTDVGGSLTVDDEGSSVRVTGSLEEAPEGSGSDFVLTEVVTPAATLPWVFEPDIAGEYRLLFIAVDDDGMTATCTTLVHAIPDEGLRVEMFWSTDGTDMDLHLLAPQASGWFSDADCYYRNCVGGLTWPPAGVEDDPHLDIDNTRGFGPENINIERPKPGAYRIGVHAYHGDAMVSVRVYCRESGLLPVASFGPTRLADRRGGPDADLWRVADVSIDSSGRCSVHPLGTSDAPNIVSTEFARAHR